MPGGKPKPTIPASANASRAGQLKTLLTQATAMLQSGQANAAEAYFRQLLALAPAHPDALKWLGVIAYQKGQLEAAVDWWQQALSAKPQDASLHSNLGLVQQQLGHSQQALASLDRALLLKPDFVEALNNRGNVLRDLNRMEEAAASYQKALRLQPKFAECQYNLGMTLNALERPAEALEWLDRCLRLMPEHAGALFRRGVALTGLERQAEALPIFQHLLAARPDDVEVLFWHCRVLFDVRRFAEALAGYQSVALTCPKMPEVHFSLANTLSELHRHEEALAAFDRALALRADYLEALYNRGGCLKDMRRHEEAAEAFAALAERNPDYRLTLDQLFHSRQYCCDWTHYQDDSQALEAAVQLPGVRAAPFSFLSVSANAALQLCCASAYTAKMCPALLQAKPRRVAGARNARRKLAYVSADFGAHPVSYLLAGVWEAHDRTQFETIGLRLRPSDGSAMARRVDQAFERMIDVSAMTAAEVAALMAELEIDIAVDLMGYTEHCKTAIFASRAAPIQVNYLGYPGTMGASYMDFILADGYVIPPEAAVHYAEKIAYLPDCFQGNDSQRAIAERVPSRSEVGLPPTGFVFCAFNNTHKLNPPLFDIWMRLLAAVPGSVLWLVAADTLVQRNLCAQAQQRGIDAQRLVFAPRIHYPDHLARMGLADLFLDTLPFNAGTTGSDALWAGLPVLTCSGEAFASRMAGSLLQALGLGDLIARDLLHYEVRAMELATLPNELAAVRARLAVNRKAAPLFDTQRFCRNLEDAYQQMWQQYEQGEAPSTFKVAGQCPA